MSRSTLARKMLFPMAALTVLVGYIVWGNITIAVTEMTVSDEKLPSAFSGFRIAQISDLHNAELGPNNARLLKLLAEKKPDIIVLTGDIIDSRRTDVAVSAAFVRAAAQISPVYYVTGNHERRISRDYQSLKAAMLEAGVTVLENETVELERSGEKLTLIGLHDPGFSTSGAASSILERNLASLSAQSDGYRILLSHRPEHIDCYAAAGMNLVFSGHAHGGQFRFPLIGGLFAPGQGWFPTYDAGLYSVGNTQLIVSRGLGQSSFPFRFNNRPELVITQLESVQPS